MNATSSSSFPHPPRLLPETPTLDAKVAQALEDDYRNFAEHGLPHNLEDYVLQRYGIDLSSQYAGRPIKNPFGKASGQLTLNAGQIDEAANAGLGFVVLKTVIAENATGERSMGAWAIPEARMVVEPITGGDGQSGWTITWNGRGWPGSLNDYIQLVRESHAIAAPAGMLVVPSVKYHLPGPDESTWRVDEYQYTTQRLVEATPDQPLVIEKDFSPTLAGNDRAASRATLECWLGEVAPRIREAVKTPTVVAIKVFNSLDDDVFQLHLLELLHRPGIGRPDALVYANRLFDPAKEFGDKRGVAYGGPDLSTRNLRILSSLRMAQARGEIASPSPPISATGDIHSGRIAVEYLLWGCSSFQIHTLFCLPTSEFAMKRGSKLERALHRLYFDPREGFIAWMKYLAHIRGVNSISVRETAEWANDVY